MLDTEPAALTAADLRNQLADIQGGLLRDYETLAYAYVFFRIGSSDGGRTWLGSLVDRVSTAAGAAGLEETLNVTVSAFGLRALDMGDRAIASFPEAFLDGMAARAKRLGDRGPAAPEHWKGGLGGPDIHLMVVLSGADPSSVDARCRTLAAEALGHDVHEVHRIEAAVQVDRRSGCPAAHFGFVDPVSQPAIDGYDEVVPGNGARSGDGWRAIAPGEFLLGYVNELGEATATPEPRELGLNGTFIAFRKARQDVAGFRAYLTQGASSLWGKADDLHRAKLGAKIVGRWRSGCPIVASPDVDDPSLAADPHRVNDFDYAQDPDGLKCPLGAHIRRMNPRATPLTTRIDVNRKRVLRRGVEFGPPLPEGTPDDGIPRGQAGLIVVADLELQFEFLQSEWIDKGDFVGLDHDERDPLIGANDGGGQFTVPGADVPFLFDLRQFVTVEGGEYFFAPSITALRGLAAGRY